MIVIVDYHMGNLGSLQNMLNKIGARGVISSDPEVIMGADKLILPGVGAFDNAMMNIRSLNLEPLLNQKVMELKTPVLGICLGMQILAKRSEEGILPGLGWIDADVIRFKVDEMHIAEKRFPIPHMGWNSIKISRPNFIFNDMDPQARYYFVHSYYFHCHCPEDILATSEYGIEFTSVVGRDHILGVQFHPEKSLRYGMTLLKNFCNGGTL